MGFVKQLTRTLPAVVAGGAIGGLGTRPTSPWYRKLDRPDWEPPPEVFAPVWTTLYAMIAGSSAKAMAKMEEEQRRSMQRALWLNMGLNAGWCWLFFTAERPRLALGEIILLEASTLSLIKKAGAVDKVAAAGLAPYAAWNGFAAALNASIVARND